MEIFFSDIPEEGLAISGIIDPKFFGLPEDDCVRITGDIQYDLTLYAFNQEVVVFSGQISGPMELQCVTCLEFVPYFANFPNWQSEYDVEEGQTSFDPRESIRDDILLALPSTPHCYEFLEDRQCPKLNLLAKFEHDNKPLEIEIAPAAGDSVWGALDQLVEDPKQES